MRKYCCLGRDHFLHFGNEVAKQVLNAMLQRRGGGGAHVVRLRAGFDRKQFVSAVSDKLKAAVRAELQLLLERAAAARA